MDKCFSLPESVPTTAEQQHFIPVRSAARDAACPK